jgi:hypothetical protein
MRWLPALLIALALAGCGGSSSSSSPSSSGSTPVASVTSATAATSKTTTSTSSTSRATKTTTQSTVTASETTAAVSTAPPPTPAGTPAAPAGLSQTTGYSTYENCSVHCSGAVPSSLRRELTLQTASGSCPRGAAAGPITAKLSARLRIGAFIGSKWDGAEVTWAAPAGFSGPILIRGRQVGGAGAIGFGEGHVPYDELQIYAAPGKAHSWPTFVRVRGAGCYAFNVDTAHKTEAFVFDAAK